MVDMVVTRTFDTTRQQVWHAWTESGEVMRWWGPAGFTSPLARMDVRQGGSSLVCMRTPDGRDLYNSWIYERVEPLELAKVGLEQCLDKMTAAVAAAPRNSEARSAFWRRQVGCR